MKFDTYIQYIYCLSVCMTICTAINVLYADLQMKTNIELAQEICETLNCTSIHSVNENAEITNRLNSFSIFTFTGAIICFLTLITRNCSCFHCLCEEEIDNFVPMREKRWIVASDSEMPISTISMPEQSIYGNQEIVLDLL